jgi:hypothetical protein
LFYMTQQRRGAALLGRLNNPLCTRCISGARNLVWFPRIPQKRNEAAVH